MEDSAYKQGSAAIGGVTLSEYAINRHDEAQVARAEWEYQRSVQFCASLIFSPEAHPYGPNCYESTW